MKIKDFQTVSFAFRTAVRNLLRKPQNSERGIFMSIDLKRLRGGYAELTAEFGEKGAAIVAGIPPKSVEETLDGKNAYTENLEKFLGARAAAYSFYPEEHREQLLKLEHFIVESGSAEKAAKALGVSKGTISYIRSCKYKGDVENFFTEFASYLKLKQEKRSRPYKGVGYVPTSVSEYMYQVIRGVHIAGDCEIITGDTGVGKSRTITKYASDYPENTVVVTPTVADGSAVGILKMIAEQLGISDADGMERLPHLTRAVMPKLHDGMLIIIDEAQHLKFQAIDHLRSISDKFTDRGETMGVCFVGNPSFMRHFDDKKLPVTGQVFNRANLRPYIKASDIKIEDIRLLFPELSAEKNTTEIKFLYAVAQTNGEGIRRAINFYRSAYNMDGGNVTIDRLAELAQTGYLKLPNIGNLIKRLREESA